MASILNQLVKYQPPPAAVPKLTIQVQEPPLNPYYDILYSLCDKIDPIAKAKAANNVLPLLNNFTPPPMADQLYPLELAVLYHLFYRHQVMFCGETATDAVLSVFLRGVTERDGSLDAYMATLKDILNPASMRIFLCRVMLAGVNVGSGKDKLPRHYADLAGKALGVKASAKAASDGLASLARTDIEDLIVGRITYLAFWYWSRTKTESHCREYLMLPAKA